MVADYGGAVNVEVFVVASAAIGIAQRKGARSHQALGYTILMDPGCRATEEGWPY